MHGRAALDLLGGAVGVREVELDALGDVGRGEDLLDAHRRAGVDQLHHQLVVRDAEVAEAAEAGARVHQEVEQHPAGGVEDLVRASNWAASPLSTASMSSSMPGNVASRRRSARRPRARPTRRRATMTWLSGRPVDAERLRVVVVERDVDVRVVGEVGGDVTGAELDLAVLHVLGMDELDVVEDAEVLEKGGAHQPVEVAARHESEALCLKLRHGNTRSAGYASGMTRSLILLVAVRAARRLWRRRRRRRLGRRRRDVEGGLRRAGERDLRRGREEAPGVHAGGAGRAGGVGRRAPRTVATTSSRRPRRRTTPTSSACASSTRRRTWPTAGRASWRGSSDAFGKIGELADATRENDSAKLQELSQQFTEIAQDTRPFAEQNGLDDCLPDDSAP